MKGSGFHPTVGDVARIETILKSISNGIQTMAGIMRENDHEIRIGRFEDEVAGHYEEARD